MYSKLDSISPPVNVQDRVGVSLSLLRRVMAVGKMKKILNIEAALEMIALGMVICSEVQILLILIETILTRISSIRIMECFQKWQRRSKKWLRGSISALSF